MDNISMILFAIVLVAQIAIFVLFFLENRYVNKRFSAMLQYIDRKVKDADCMEEVESRVNELLNAFGEKIDDRFDRNDDATKERIEQCVTEHVKAMELDYAQAQAAANKVNEFAYGLSAIFDYNPLAAIKNGRNKEAI